MEAKITKTFILAASSLFGLGLFAAEIVWTGAVDGDWDTAGNWDSAQVPTLSDDVTVNGAVHCSGDLFAKSLTIGSSGVVRFHATTATTPNNSIADAPGDGKFTFQVAEDVVCAGGKLSIHGRGAVITNLAVSIGGDLRLTGAARMCVAAATFDGADVSPESLYRNATRVDVGGAISIEDTAILYPVADEKVGTAVRFSAASFSLASGAQVDASQRGWHWLSTPADPRCTNALSRSRYTFALGYGFDNPRVGAGHGGLGSSATVRNGKVYGKPYAPFLPGSPGGGDSNWTLAYDSTGGCVRGGGVFWIVVSGEAAVDGTVKAFPLKSGWQASSGGSIWIAAGSFAFGANALLDAHGADFGNSTKNAAGGGGRISLAQGLSAADLDALALGGDTSGLLLADSITLVPVSVAGGALDAGGSAGDGTATFVSSAAAVRMVSVNFNPVAATGVSPEYGDHPKSAGDSVAFSAGAYGFDPTDATWRYPCAGYVVSNATVEIASGNGRGYSTTVSETMSLTWLWGERECLSWLDVSGPGSLSTNGATFVAGTDAWFKESTTVRVTAVPANGAEFLYWLGEIEEGQRLSSEITIAATEQRHLTAVFRTAAAPGTYTWTNAGTGDFLDGANWDAGTPPGVADAAAVPAGTCRLPDYVRVGALAVSGSGAVVAARTVPAAGYTNAVLSVTGNLTLSDGASLTLGPVSGLDAYHTAGDGFCTVYNTLSVGGDLILDGSARLRVAAGRRRGGFTWETGCGFVDVAGSFRLLDSSVFEPVCDGYMGGGVKTTVGDCLEIGTNATVFASGRGMGLYRTIGFLSGIGTSGTAAAGHGGNGGNGRENAIGNNGTPYDYAYAPRMPGQQNREAGSAALSRGGGTVRVHARTIVMDGAIEADGMECSGGCASGGTIWLTASASIEVSRDARFSARGASSTLNESYGSGGGGRIAFAEYATAAQLAALTATPSAIPEGLDDVTEQKAPLCLSLADAVAPGDPARGNSACWGTVRWLQNTSLLPTTYNVTVSGNPVLATGTIPVCGSFQSPSQTVFSFSAGAYGNNPQNETWRYPCLGYVVSNDTAEIARGDGRAYSATVESDMTLIWLWGGRECQWWLASTGPGSLATNGAAVASGADVWFGEDATVRLAAVPEAGAEFLYWIGEIEEGRRFSPEITVAATEQRHLTAVFRTVAAPGTYTWTNAGTGDFLDGANWDAGTPPGVADSAAVPTGTCRLPDYVRVGALAVSGSGSVVSARTVAEVGHSNVVLSVAGDLTLSDGASLMLAPVSGLDSLHTVGENFCSAYNALSVGGDLILDGSARLRVAAGRRGGGFTWETGCGFVDVAGSFRLLGSSVFELVCDGYYGGAVRTTVGGRFEVGANAAVFATGRGMGLYGTLGWSLGAGNLGTTGAGHGGSGQNGSARWGSGQGCPYDYAYAPRMPGQQNRDQTSATVSRGGGAVRVHARSITVDGTIEADGLECGGGCASGGAIWLTASASILVSPDAVLSAKGATSTINLSNGSGGGGRVAFAERATDAQLAALVATPNSIPEGLEDVTQEMLAALPALADAAAPGDTARGTAACWGTVVWLRNPKLSPTVLLLR